MGKAIKEKQRKKDLQKIIYHAEKIDRVATKYGMRGNLAQVYIQALDELDRVFWNRDIRR